MSYSLDINVVSETIRNRPNKVVIEWLDPIPAEALFVSVLTLGEIRKGIEGLTDRKRREKLRIWLEHELTKWFERESVACGHLGRNAGGLYKKYTLSGL